MSEKKPTYPNSFLFGCVAGGTLQAFTRFGTIEPLSARPFAYLKTALLFGSVISYYDWWRRCAMEQVMEGEDRRDYHRLVRSVNKNVRYGEEDEKGNLTDYLAGATLRY